MEIKSVLNQIKPFNITFDKINYFKHRNSYTAWMNPKSDSNTTLNTLYDLCSNLYSFNKTRRVFTPHMTIGQFNNINDINDMIKNVSWKPINTEVNGLYLISRKGKNDPFKIYYKIPFEGDDVIKVI